ncbi:hypothetical protein AK830_g9574 [Neonectria ditissima]|uniref:Uncharacterized protein n=1 Tax=Neonectria ditissima TaxID=78410 RepID=A0A0P7B5H8_9HYPO|nr:hypothetical protein AK830_g9574 [Neonectria ditissima]
MEVNTQGRRRHFDILLQHRPPREESDSTPPVVTITRTVTITTVTPLVPDLMVQYLEAIDLVLLYLNTANSVAELHSVKYRAAEWCGAHYGSYRPQLIQPCLNLYHPMLFNLDIPSWYRLDKPSWDETLIDHEPQQPFDLGHDQHALTRHVEAETNPTRSGRQEPFAPPSQQVFMEHSQQTVLDKRCIDPIIHQHSLLHQPRLDAYGPFQMDAYSHYRTPFTANDIKTSPIMRTLPEVIATLAMIDMEAMFRKRPMSQLAQPYKTTYAKLRECPCLCSKKKP